MAKLFLRGDSLFHVNSSAQHKVEQDFFGAGKTSFRMEGTGHDGRGREVDMMGGKEGEDEERRVRREGPKPQPNTELSKT